MKPLSIFVTVTFLVSTLNGQSKADTSAAITFKTFTASKQMDYVKLNWSIACNIQYAQFEILRSDDGTNFKTINSFKAGHARCAQPFEYTDKTAVGPVLYKIKTGDIDGKFSTEKTVSIIGKEIAGTTIKAISPALKNNLRCIVAAAEPGKANIVIASTSGILTKQLTLSFSKGVSHVDINVGELPKGIYTFTYIIGGEKKFVRFLKG